MRHTAIALYDDYGAARRAYNALLDAGLDREEVFLAAHDETRALDEEGQTNVEGTTVGTGSELFTGDLVNTLTDWGVPRERAEFYAESIRRGGSAVIAHGFDTDAHGDIEAILNRHRPVHPERRLTAYREIGYAGFDRTAGPYTIEQVRAERARWGSAHAADEAVDVYRA